jgi:dGTPase
VRRMIGAMVDDVLVETCRRAAEAKAKTPDDVRHMPRSLVAFSPEMFEDLARLRAFLLERMYRHYKVNRTRSQARRMLGELFKLFLTEPEVLPDDWQARAKGLDTPGLARVVCDYIAGMTDIFALEEHRRLLHLDAVYMR